MRKAVLSISTLVLVLFALLTPAYAAPPMPVEGLWEYLPYDRVKNEFGECVVPEMDYSFDPPKDIDTRERCVRESRGNTYIQTFEFGRWSGSFAGVSEELGTVVIHRSGAVFFWGRVYFEGTVDGKGGTMEMFVYGMLPDGAPEWQGRWVILSGTGDLEDLRGRGPWWGPGWQGDPSEYGKIFYSGKIRFDDD